MMIRPTPGQPEHLSQPWMADAERYFSRGKNTRLPWPVGSIMISDKHRVLYSPIAKCACTSLKTMMVQLAGVKHAREIIRLGVHRTTDKFNTGMQLKDQPRDHVMDILKSENYYKFAVIRDPVRRIISAYTEKFVVNRLNEGNKLHTGEVVQSVQSRLDPDMDVGITFRQFVNFLVSREPLDLDPHWAPQHSYLRGVVCYNRIYRVDQLDELKSTLEAWTHTKIKLRQLNTSASPSNQHIIDGSDGSAAVNLLPAQLQAMGKLSADMFMDQELIDVLKQYYAKDESLFQQTFESGENYRPDPLADHALLPPERTVDDASNARVWSRVNIYSKGFLGLRDDGRGSTGIAIVNDSIIAIDGGRFPGLQVEYRILDCNEQFLSDKATVHPLAASIPAGGSLQLNLEIVVPTEWLERAHKIQVKLVCSDRIKVAKNSLAHVANAEIVRVAG
jgi:hypothetical protein